MDFELLQKYIIGDASESEKKQVVEWLEESPEHMREYMTQRKLYDMALWRTIPEKENQTEGENFRWKVFAMRLATAVAVATLAFIVSYYGWGKQEKEVMSQTIYVPAGQRVELILSDGTKVWLNSRSRFTFPGTFDEEVRQVELDGEGYFEVKSDKERPFVVQTHQYNVRVLGTEFNLMAYSTDSIWETSLLKGVVEILMPGSDSSGIKLEQNTMLSLRGDKLVKEPIKETDYFLWREGLLCFKDVTLRDMIEKLKQHYGVEIVVNNTRILKNRYTGKFRTIDGVEHVLKVLRLNNKFTYTKDDESNIITIN